jgi:hypothetical protein
VLLDATFRAQPTHDIFASGAGFSGSTNLREHRKHGVRARVRLPKRPSDDPFGPEKCPEGFVGEADPKIGGLVDDDGNREEFEKRGHLGSIRQDVSVNLRFLRNDVPSADAEFTRELAALALVEVELLQKIQGARNS